MFFTSGEVVPSRVQLCNGSWHASHSLYSYPRFFFILMFKLFSLTCMVMTLIEDPFLGLRHIRGRGDSRMTRSPLRREGSSLTSKKLFVLFSNRRTQMETSK